MQFMHWDQRFDYEQSINFLHAIGEQIAPQAVRERFPDFPWDSIPDLLDYSFDYASLSSTADAAVLRQYQALYKKFEPLRLSGVDKEQTAWAKFTEFEQQCKSANALFSTLIEGKTAIPFHLHETYLLAQQKIRSILGDAPKLSRLRLRCGPGATTNVKKENASVTRKFSSVLACSEPTVKYLSEIFHELPHLCPFVGDEGVVDVEVHHGRLQFVPKDAKQYRAIVVEPFLTGLVQLGLCDYMSHLLRASGIDITDQSRNQRAARIGSLTGELATLDLSSASDSISTSLVEFLLPQDWFFFLSRYRSDTVLYKGEIIKLEKFSSMGNGFTFPLETLIFYALSWAASSKRGKVLAYGDDIIVATTDMHSVIEILEFSGFTINKKKSFGTGPFRESCGADYLSGIDIRPFYIDDYVSCERLFSLHNYFKRNFEDELAEYVVSYIHPTLRIYGPDGFGDGHLIGEWLPIPHKRDQGWAGYTFETHTWKAKNELRVLPGDRILPAYSIYVRDQDKDPDYWRIPSTQRAAMREERRINALRDYMRMDKGHETNRWKFFSIRKWLLAWEESLGLPVIKGNPRPSLPGVRGYKRIKIYTLVTG